MISFPSFKIERDHAWNWILKLIAYPYLTALFAKFINWPPKIKIFIFLSSLNWIMQNKLFKNWILSSQKQQQHQQHKKSINQAFILRTRPPQPPLSPINYSFKKMWTFDLSFAGLYDISKQRYAFSTKLRIYLSINMQIHNT